MPDGIDIRIGADVQQGLAGVRAVDASLVKLNQSTLNLVRSLKNDLDPNISSAFKKGVVSVSGMKAALETLRENMRLATNPAQIIQYNRAIKDLELNIKKVGVAGLATGSSLSSGFTKGYSALRTLANVLPGIGIGGLVGFAVTGITNLVNSLGKVKTAYSSAAVQAEVFRNANKSIGDDTARLSALVAVARDVSFSTQQRTNAIAELQKLYPGYLRNITLENINSSAAATAIDALTKSLVSKAIAQAYSTKIAEESLKADDLRAKMVKLETDQLKDQFGFLQQLNKARASGSFISKDIFKNQELGQARYTIEIGETTKALIGQEAAITDLFNRTKAATAQSLDFVATPKIKDVKIIDSFALKNKWGKLLRDAFDGDVLPPSFTIFDKFPMTDALEDAINKGIIDVKELKTNRLANSIATDLNLDLIKEFGPMFAKLGKNLPTINFKLSVSTNRAEIEKELKKALDLKDFNDKLTRTMQQTGADALSSIAEGLGDAFATGDITGIFAGFANAVAGGLQAIGKQMVMLSPVITALKAALKTLNPAILLPAGLALIAIGAGLRGIVGKGITGLAKGGKIPPGFPNDSFPALLSSGETVIPAKGYGGQANVHHTGRFEIDGKKLVLVLNRTLASEGRTE